MSLIGDSPYTRLDLPDVRPAPRLDQHTLADVTAQRDAALGWLASIYAAYARADAETDGTRLRRHEMRQLEDQAAADVWRRITSAADEDDVVETWRLISIRQEVTG